MSTPSAYAYRPRQPNLTVHPTPNRAIRDNFGIGCADQIGCPDQVALVLTAQKSGFARAG
jgi:hypothetical protein